MPRIFDNIDNALLPELSKVLSVSNRADFCVGYFNLRGWRKIDEHIESWSGENGNACRLLVGMHQSPEQGLREKLATAYHDDGIDNARALELKKQLAEEFRTQLTLGAPNNSDEAGLRRLARQIRAGKVIVKLFLRHPLHAKLYLLHRSDPVNPKVGFVGSSNLTFAGLSFQGELNVDVMEHDACDKLAAWFEDRWNDRWCIDISDELATIIEESWAGEALIDPYYVYLKIAYHLAQEARHGQSEFRIPAIFGNKLFDFQTSAVKVAAHHLNKRGGVVIGDVVGLGKSIMASALLKIVEEVDGRSLIICPKSLVDMWEDYVETYELSAKIVSLSRVESELPELRRYRTVLIDESHNLRNREGKRYRVIEDYIRSNDSQCILLSATPYNKSFIDLSSQLRLFIEDDQDIGVRPEAMIRAIGGETEFVRKHQCAVRSLPAFEKSDQTDDWRELMRLYMIRRTRGFILQNYAETDGDSERKFITFADGTRSYFPVRQPKTVKFEINATDQSDPYAKAYSNEVVSAVDGLRLPRYGLANYLTADPAHPPTPAEVKVMDGLGRAGIRLMGFCKTNLFKRLESGGPAFIQSLERHVMRNLVYLHALEKNLPVPIGTQDAELLDFTDEDVDSEAAGTLFADGELAQGEAEIAVETDELDRLKDQAAQIYDLYQHAKVRRFKWLKASLFKHALQIDLMADVEALRGVLRICGAWDEERDTKLKALIDLVCVDHPTGKILIFTQFADTARYLEAALKKAGVTEISAVTGQSESPTRLAWRFSPRSNKKEQVAQAEGELRVLVATDVLSEGQNLQDCSTIVNFDLPWAIIRLIQRAGRVDRIGQQADTINCYSFLPADGVERIIRLRSRVRARLQENQEVVGSDEAFFEDDDQLNPIQDLYSEKSGVLDGDDDGEVDLASYAFQIWQNAVKSDPKLQKIVEDLPDVVYATKAMPAMTESKEGALVYIRTPDDNDALAWVDRGGAILTQSPLAILRAAECEPKEPALERTEFHHDIVRAGVEHLMQEERTTHGALGRPSGARFKTYDRLKRWLERQGNERTLFVTDHFVRDVEKAMADIYEFPLFQSTIDALNRQLKTGISDIKLAEMVIAFREDGRLCMKQDKDAAQSDMRIICSMGLEG
ncbi:NgoFVII family restriction endonuclease (plasmid) [Rhizobium leguminosarum]|uniref:helicase-related protein n=1 Tax=Rhizobium leguminosarum TaxID=384 RepID=UPI0010322FA9|nr:helicase-related protein [Rhizobium leguminosarum]TBF23430.1 NgoFVII family restriction endonuclease [Rhizobium leguminosarum]TBG29524.1 NgoFVII family restriction endonuclease [Rhizobium leguminosarum]